MNVCVTKIVFFFVLQTPAEQNQARMQLAIEKASKSFCNFSVPLGNSARCEFASIILKFKIQSIFCMYLVIDLVISAKNQRQCSAVLTFIKTPDRDPALHLILLNIESSRIFKV